MKIQEALGQLLARQDLHVNDMEDVMRQIMTGEATPSQIGGFLVALRMKGETVDEVAAAAAVMRSLSDGVTLSFDNAIDIVAHSSEE